MKNAQELIDAIKDVPEELFDQNLYEDVVRPQCGCVMHHYEMNKYLQHNDNCDREWYLNYFDLSVNEWRYIFGSIPLIRTVSTICEFPVDLEFTVQSAIERIKFIDSLSNEK